MKRLRHYDKDLAVVLSVFGSSETGALAQYEKLKEEVKNSLSPDVEVRMSISSRTVLKKLEKEGKMYNTLAEELANIDRLGYKKIVVASINLFPTDEHDYLVKITDGFKNNISPARYEVTAPIFTKTKATNAYLKELDAKLKQEYGDITFVYLAHGTPSLYGVGNQAFSYVKDYLKMINPESFFFTIEGGFKYEKEFLTREITNDAKVLIVPLLLVAGNHMKNDIEEIRTELEEEVFSIETPNFSSLLTLENTRKYFIDEINQAIKKLNW